MSIFKTKKVEVKSSKTIKKLSEAEMKILSGGYVEGPIEAGKGK